MHTQYLLESINKIQNFCKKQKLALKRFVNNFNGFERKTYEKKAYFEIFLIINCVFIRLSGGPISHFLIFIGRG